MLWAKEKSSSAVISLKMVWTWNCSVGNSKIIKWDQFNKPFSYLIFKCLMNMLWGSKNALASCVPTPKHPWSPVPMHITCNYASDHKEAVSFECGFWQEKWTLCALWGSWTQFSFSFPSPHICHMKEKAMVILQQGIQGALFCTPSYI